MTDRSGYDPCVPNQPKTPARGIRVPDELWAAAKAKSQADGTTISAILVAALEEYVDEDATSEQ